MTLKEYLHQSNHKLDVLADEAERQRTFDEEYSYDKRMEGCDEELEEQLIVVHLVRVCADYKYTHTAKSESG